MSSTVSALDLSVKWYVISTLAKNCWFVEKNYFINLEWWKVVVSD